jgi:hypothetical protein
LNSDDKKKQFGQTEKTFKRRRIYSMRAYHQLVFDEFLEGAVTLYTDPGFNSQLAMTEKLMLYAIADTVSGTANLTVQIEEGPDGVHFQNRNASAELTANGMSTSANTTAVGRDFGSNLGTGFVRLRVALAGTTPKAHVRIWATGRGEQGS